MLLIVARKIHCINWEKIWSSREYEGQRVRKIREFNLVLLVSGAGDCMLMGRLWYKVLATKYGEGVGTS